MFFQPCSALLRCDFNSIDWAAYTYEHKLRPIAILLAMFRACLVCLSDTPVYHSQIKTPFRQWTRVAQGHGPRIGGGSYRVAARPVFAPCEPPISGPSVRPHFKHYILH